MFEVTEELYVGVVSEVSGTRIRVDLSANIVELTRSYGGDVYGIGQIGTVITHIHHPGLRSSGI